MANEGKRPKKSDGDREGSSDSVDLAKEILDEMRSHGENGWRDGLADPHTAADRNRDAELAHLNRYANDESRLMSYHRYLQKLVHVCRAPKCTQKYETGAELSAHQESAHSHWPRGMQQQEKRVTEDPLELRSAMKAVEYEFSSMMQVLISQLSDESADIMRLTQRLNELQDVYASRSLPTAAALSAGAVLYASFLAHELREDDDQKLTNLLRITIANLHLSQGLGGELEFALRSLRFRSAMLDEGELRVIAEGEPRDVFRDAARSVLFREAALDNVKISSGVLGEPMRQLLTAVLTAGSAAGDAAQMSAQLQKSWARVPWGKKLVSVVMNERR